MHITGSKVTELSPSWFVKVINTVISLMWTVGMFNANRKVDNRRWRSAQEADLVHLRREEDLVQHLLCTDTLLYSTTWNNKVANACCSCCSWEIQACLVFLSWQILLTTLRLNNLEPRLFAPGLANSYEVGDWIDYYPRFRLPSRIYENTNARLVMNMYVQVFKFCYFPFIIMVIGHSKKSGCKWQVALKHGIIKIKYYCAVCSAVIIYLSTC